MNSGAIAVRVGDARAVKRFVWVVALLGCDQGKKPAPPSPVPLPTVVQADAGAIASIDLFAAMPSTIEVSSQVANAAIKPQHIADRDLETAWNSATGKLGGEWIDISVPTATVRELRLTVGHTGHGPKGEDYFTMNPRIREVTIIASGKTTHAKLDITNRELQAIPLEATGNIRVVIDAVEMGSKRAWREVAISELQAWGTPSASWKAPAKPFTPTVTVYTPPAPDPLDPCNGAEAERDAFIKLHEHDHYSGPGGEDHAYPPRCDYVEVPALPEGWLASSGCQVQDEIYGPKRCILNLQHGDDHAAVVIDQEMQSAEFSIPSIEEADAVHGVAIRFITYRGNQLAVCRGTPLACTEPLVVGSGDFATKQTITADAILVEAVSGSPPDGVIGKHALAFH